VKSNDFTITIAIISRNRYFYLKRLVETLLEVKNPNNIPLKLVFNLESSRQSELVDFVYNMKWPYGEKIIKKRIRTSSTLNAVTESWYPSSSNDFGLLLEETVEVSPYFLMWIEKKIGFTIK
jgi:hypothetical protein